MRNGICGRRQSAYQREIAIVRTETSTSVSRTTASRKAAFFSRRHTWAGYLLGFSLSGFFDGILLHQVLQWHHLLSAIEAGIFGDIRVQVMADGLFHAAMYAVAAAGFAMLLSTRRELARPNAGRWLMANVWLGFAAWHVVDALLSHWLTGIHRIKMNAENPLVWDIGWLVVFGLLPLWWGLRLRKRARNHDDRDPDGDTSSSRDERRSGKTADLEASDPGMARTAGGSPTRRASRMAAVLVTTIVACGVITLAPLREVPGETITVVLRPGVNAAGLFAGLDGTDARILWSDASGGVWVLRDDPAHDSRRFYRHGAMYVSGTVTPAGCAEWFRT